MSNAHRSEIDRQVAQMLSKNPAFSKLPVAERTEIQRNTADILETLAAGGPRRSTADPYAVPHFNGSVLPPLPGTGTTPTPQFTGGAQPGGAKEAFGPKVAGDFGTAIATGTSQAGALLRQVNFPGFVAELIQGVFQAVVDASMQQMKAYGELVQGVAMSLNDFRDANVTENQGRDHLVSKFPKLMQIKVTDGGPRVGLRPGADPDDIPNVAETLGLDHSISHLDDEIIEEQLVPAARNDLARSRQTLLATTLLMGINRIVVTDGRINARLRFSFAARDQMTRHAEDYDYVNRGTTVVEQSSYEEAHETGEGYSETKSPGWFGSQKKSGESSRWTQGSDQRVETPAIYLEGISSTATSAELEAQASLAGDVSLNFKSETVDLNQLASAGEIFRLERVRSAGRGALQPGGAGDSDTPSAEPAT
jgi:hypothetical protein